CELAIDLDDARFDRFDPALIFRLRSSVSLCLRLAECSVAYAVAGLPLRREVLAPARQRCKQRIALSSPHGHLCKRSCCLGAFRPLRNLNRPRCGSTGQAPPRGGAL